MYPEKFINIQSEKMPGSRQLANFHRGYGFHRIFWIIFFFVKVVLTYCQGKYAIDHLDDFSLFSGAAATFFVPLLGMSKLYSRLIYNQRIKKMFEIVDNEFWDTSIVNKELSDKLSLRVSLVSKFASNNIYSSLVVTFLLAVFPLAKYPDGTRQLPSVVWFPFDTNWSPLHEFIYIFLIFGQYMIVLSNGNYDHIYIYFSQNLSVQFCLLKECLRNITNVPTISDDEKYNSRRYQLILKDRLKHCVNHHIKINNFLMDIQDIYSFCLGVQVVLSILSLVFIGYILETEDNDIAKTLKLLAYVTVLSVQACLYAVHGSELEHQYETVANAIYDSEWYFGDKHFRQGMQFILMTAQKPIQITALGLTEINNTSIVMMYKTVFSILTLIKQLVNSEL